MPWYALISHARRRACLPAEAFDFVDVETPKGILLHGPPGTGKTSLIYSLANKLGYSICIVSLSDDIYDHDLMQQIATAPSKSILLFEDIDVALPSEKRKREIKQRDQEFNSYRSYNWITLSGILNCLDGVSTPDAHVVFMTTNHKINLEPALIRPGRLVSFDHAIKL